MNLFEVFFNRWQCAVFWRYAVDDLCQLDDRISGAEYRPSSQRHHDAGSIDLLHVGGVPRWQNALMAGGRAL